MNVNARIYPCAAAAIAASLTACAGSGAPPSAMQASLPAVAHRTAGLGPVVQSRFGGDIFGWDIDQNGNDGLLTETVINGVDFLNVTETFDQSTGKIVKVVRKKLRSNANVEPVAEAIAGSDVGVIDVETVLAGTRVERDDHFDVLNPVSRNKITGRSAPPQRLDVVPSYVTDNQGSPSQLMTALYFKGGASREVFYGYDASRNAWSHRFEFPEKDLFSPLTITYAAVDSASGEGVVGYLKRAGYNPRESPTFDVVDAASGKHLRSFQGIGYGFINGMAIDPATDMLCTTTFGDMDVEFYHLASGKGKAVQIPVLTGGGALTQGASVAADPVHHLFLVAQLNSTFSPSGGSTVIVYDEKGKLVEYINGFNFLNQNSVVVPRVAINPSSRTGYVNGPNSNELQDFNY